MTLLDLNTLPSVTDEVGDVGTRNMTEKYQYENICQGKGLITELYTTIP